VTRAELEALARKATPGPWYSVGPPWLASDQSPWVNAGSADPHRFRPVCDLAIQDDEGDGEPGFVANAYNDAQYIAACSPDRILALLARVRRLEDALAHSRGQWIHSVNAPECMAALADEARP
jgi:hypothetical protein